MGTLYHKLGGRQPWRQVRFDVDIHGAPRRHTVCAAPIGYRLPEDLWKLTEEDEEETMTKEPEEKSMSIRSTLSLQQSLAVISETEPMETMPEGAEDEAEAEAACAEDGAWDPEDIANIPEPPDGGWGWVIVAASFLCNMVVDGIAYTFGIFMSEFVRYYDAPQGKTAWVGSLLSGCYLSAGPVVSALTNRYGCRAVTMAGSVVACLAFLLSTLSPSVDVLMVTYGIMGGIGFGLIYLPAIVGVGYYFSTKRAFATGVAVCGSGMGAFVFAPVCNRLLEYYGWKGALIILAGLSLNCMVFGALMRPLEAPTHPLTKPLLQRMAEEKQRLREDSLCNSQFVLVQHSDGTVEKRPTLFLNTEPGVHSTFYLDQFGRSPMDTPVITLSPIEEVRKSPVSSKEDENEEKEHPGEEAPLNANQSQDLPTQPPNGHVPNGPTIPSAIKEFAKRKGLLPQRAGGTMKLSLSNITVNNPVPVDIRRRSPSMKFTSSSILYSSNRNNNYLVEEVWKKLQQEEEEQLPLDGSRRPSLKPKKKDFARPMYRKDIFYSGSILNLPEYQSQKDVRSYVASVISIPKEPAPLQELPMHQEPQQKDKYFPRCFKLPKSMTDTLQEMLDFSLLRCPVFLLICIANVFGMMGFYIPFVYIIDNATSKGVPKGQAAFLLSIIGITNTVGRLFFGWLSDRPRINSLVLNNICLVLSGLCILFIPLCNDYVSIVIDCIIFGLFVSAYICLTSIILVDLLGLDRLTNAFGLLSLFRGAASIVGPPAAGSIYDMTGSYDLTFFISGGLLIFSALLSSVAPCISRWVERRQHEPPETDPPKTPVPPLPPVQVVTPGQQPSEQPEGADVEVPEVVTVEDVETVV